MTELELAELAIKGNKQAFCSLYAIYKDKLYGYAYYRLANSHDAQDAVSDCILSAYQQITTLRNAKAFSAWLFRIMSACCNAKIKEHISARNMSNIDDEQNSLLTYDTDIVEKTELAQALDMLSESEREIVILSVVGGFTSGEIAKITDMTSGSVRSKLSRSLAKMRNFLE